MFSRASLLFEVGCAVIDGAVQCIPLKMTDLETVVPFGCNSPIVYNHTRIPAGPIIQGAQWSGKQWDRIFGILQIAYHGNNFNYTAILV